jgi:putative ABC transport system permease protein
VNLGSVALSYARRSPLTTLLNVIMLTLGVATVVLLLLLSRQLDESLQREARGIDLVVGAKGSPLQLILAGVYHLDVPPGNIALDEVQKLRVNPLIAQVIPISLGDSYLGFRIVGTEPAFVTHYGAELASSRLWQAPLEAVLGAEVARRSSLAVGGQFAGSHGLSVGGAEHADDPYRVVGILRPTGTVIDRLVVTGTESVWKIHEHHHEHESDSATKAQQRTTATGATENGGASHDDDDDDSNASDKQVTMALVRYASPLAAASLPRQINNETSLQAASPAYESARLFTTFGFGTDIIWGFALLLIVASCLGIFIALFQAMDARQYDIAVMRTLGAGRRRVFTLMLLESLVLAGTGTVLGLLLGHAMLAAIAAWLPAAAPLAEGARHWFPEELVVILIALGGGILAALVPAWRAYRLDVAATLSKG